MQYKSWSTKSNLEYLFALNLHFAKTEEFKLGIHSKFTNEILHSLNKILLLKETTLF